jgi:hypothetical protein
MALPNDPPNTPTLRRSDSTVTTVLLIMMLGGLVFSALFGFWLTSSAWFSRLRGEPYDPS